MSFSESCFVISTSIRSGGRETSGQPSAAQWASGGHARRAAGTRSVPGTEGSRGVEQAAGRAT